MSALRVIKQDERPQRGEVLQGPPTREQRLWSQGRLQDVTKSDVENTVILIRRAIKKAIARLEKKGWTGGHFGLVAASCEKEEAHTVESENAEVQIERVQLWRVSYGKILFLSASGVLYGRRSENTVEDYGDGIRMFEKYPLSNKDLVQILIDGEKDDEFDPQMLINILDWIDNPT